MKMRSILLSSLLIAPMLGLAMTGIPSLSDSDEEIPNLCSYLYVHIANETGTRVMLNNNPEFDRWHGYFVRLGEASLDAGVSTIWIMNQNPLAGPQGKISYAWFDSTGHKQICEITYNQSYCGIYSAGINTTSANGSCFVYNEPLKPSKTWGYQGEAWVRLSSFNAPPATTINQ